MSDDGFLQGMSGIERASTYPLIDRGYDRGLYRFCVVVPVVDTVGDTVQTDRGTFRVLRRGARVYTKGEVSVCNYYLDASAADLGAPIDRLTPEQQDYRDQRRSRQKAALAAYNAGVTPDERRAAGKRAWEQYRARTTPAERAARTRAGVAEYWRIMRADPATLAPGELARRSRAEAKGVGRPRTPETRARIAAGTKQGIAKARESKRELSPAERAAKLAEIGVTVTPESVARNVAMLNALGKRNT